MLFEEQGLVMEAQEPVLQLLSGHPRDVLSCPSILIRRQVCKKYSLICCLYKLNHVCDDK